MKVVEDVAKVISSALTTIPLLPDATVKVTAPELPPPVKPAPAVTPVISPTLAVNGSWLTDAYFTLLSVSTKAILSVGSRFPKELPSVADKIKLSVPA